MTNEPRPHRWRRATALAVVGLLVLAGCSQSSDSEGSTTIRITSQDFSEQKTLAEAYGQFLKAKGFDVDVQESMATRTLIYSALEAGDVDLVLDYQGSATVELGGKASSDTDATYDALTTALKTKDLAASEASEAVDANALVALSSWAKENEVTTISDLAGLDGPLTLGGAEECADRPDCLLGYEDTYGLSLEFKAVSYGPPLVAALEAGEIQLAQYGTTAPEVAEGKIVVLDDDKGLQSAENVVPVFRTAVDSEDLQAALDELSGVLTTADLAAWNQATDVDKEDPADVAEAWLKEKRLI